MAVVAAIGDDMAAFQAGYEDGSSIEIVALACRQDDTQR